MILERETEALTYLIFLPVLLWICLFLTPTFKYKCMCAARTKSECLHLNEALKIEKCGR